jgi:hypothetical protein
MQCSTDLIFSKPRSIHHRPHRIDELSSLNYFGLNISGSFVGANLLTAAFLWVELHGEITGDTFVRFPK